MRKRVRPAQNKGDQHDYNPDDIVSRMTDEILVTILSLLPLKDAAVTSQLSRRWRYMWCWILCLDLEDEEKMFKILENPKSRLRERNRYINWVNRVLFQHRSPMIEKFKICFDLDKHSRSAITNWINFAISKDVKVLELDLMETGDNLSDPIRNYVFPKKILDKKLGSSLKKQSLYKGMGIKFLNTLILKCVNIDDETLGKILVCCPVLKNLIIFNAADLINVKISGPSLALTRFELTYCCMIESIEICDSNLWWFKYLGVEITLKLDNNPKLNIISIGEGFSGIENNLFQQISSCIPYLKALELNIFRPKEDLHLLSFPELPNVKKLSLVVGAWEDDSLLGLTSLVKACPNLRKIVIQLVWRTPERRKRQVTLIENEDNEIHQRLETVEIRGFYGRISDIELVLYLYQNSVSLKEIVVDSTYQVDTRGPIDDKILEQQRLAKSAAYDLLEPEIPLDVNLIIL